jgi:starch phosphorylase
MTAPLPASDPPAAGVVAYFSMEIGLEPAIPTYSGGLGMLAGDTIRSAADLGVPLVALSLVHRKGHFRQVLSEDGAQSEAPMPWDPASRATEVSPRAQVEIEGRTVTLRAWRYDVRGLTGHVVPVFLLDADLDGNAPQDRAFTDWLYGGDDRYRLCQEVLLGIGGVRMLRALGYTAIRRYHMNEGHAALLTVELAYERSRAAGSDEITTESVRSVKNDCVFTTHTPVAAGHDKFPLRLLAHVITGYGHRFDARAREFCLNGMLNMTYLGLDNSRYINGVAKRHGEIARHMFAQYKIDSITNGVHAATWVAPWFAALFDRHVPDWRGDNASLRCAAAIARSEIWEAHQQAKSALLRAVSESSGAALAPDSFTIGFARRATTWKRAELLLHDPGRLAAIAATIGPIQILYAGKAHPHDQDGKQLIRRLYAAIGTLKDRVCIVYLENYDMALARLLVAGADLWLNTPQPPFEASGTSGMKAALNGVPSLSVLDGWWVEGCIEGVTGWAIRPQNGNDNRAGAHHDDDSADAAALYSALEHTILPMFYRARESYVDVMRQAISLNGSYFNTERMMDQYVRKAYSF